MTEKELLDHFATVALPAIIATNQEVSFLDMCDELLDDRIENVTRAQWQYMFGRYAASLAYGYAEAMIDRRESVHEGVDERLAEERAFEDSLHD